MKNWYILLLPATDKVKSFVFICAKKCSLQTQSGMDTTLCAVDV